MMDKIRSIKIITCLFGIATIFIFDWLVLFNYMICPALEKYGEMTSKDRSLMILGFALLTVSLILLGCIVRKLCKKMGFD